MILPHGAPVTVFRVNDPNYEALHWLQQNARDLFGYERCEGRVEMHRSVARMLPDTLVMNVRACFLEEPQYIPNPHVDIGLIDDVDMTMFRLTFSDQILKITQI